MLILNGPFDYSAAVIVDLAIGFLPKDSDLLRNKDELRGAAIKVVSDRLRSMASTDPPWWVTDALAVGHRLAAAAESIAGSQAEIAADMTPPDPLAPNMHGPLR